ncbi:hypothetical protein LINGRAHAP2_LOCUS35675 [Linum grandiflorum]
MAWRSGASSFSRSFISSARSSSTRSSSAPLPRLRPPSTSAPRIQSPRFSFSRSRNLGELGCVASLLPLHGVVLTSHISTNLRAFCDLAHGT